MDPESAALVGSASSSSSPSSSASLKAGSTLSKEILTLITDHPNGITIAEIKETIGIPEETIVSAGNVLLKQGRVELSKRRDGEFVYHLSNPEETIVSAGNVLLKQGRVELSKRRDGEFVYHLSNPEETAKIRGLAPEEMLVFQLIDKEGDKGGWLRDIRQKSGYQGPQITKIIKTLETRKLIKSVTSITSKNKKVYMRYDIEPSREITGGAWYTDAEFDSEFIQQLNETCYLIICKKGFMSVEEVAQELRKTNIARVELKVDDIQMILDTLIFDGKVEEVHLKTRKAYKPSKLHHHKNGYTTVPCGMCPVASLCSDEGDITPTKCKYYKAWLEI